MNGFRRYTRANKGFSKGRAFEHWYRDNTVYFITARCANRNRSFASEESKAIFWDRFDHYAKQYGFIPWVTTLVDNHYHTLGYLKIGENLGKFMQRLHGSVAKLVNDVLLERQLPFWRIGSSGDYFDWCVRDEVQCRRAYRYTLIQSVRHGKCGDWGKYAHTRVNVELERGVVRAKEIGAFMEGVRYKRYEG